VRNRAAQLLIAVLLIVSVGGHWAFLQSVAWVSMVIDFSKNAPLSVAVEKTFDGKHPCNLCKIVKHAQESDQKQDAIKEKTKCDSWLLAAVIPYESPQPLVERTSYAQPFLCPLSETPPLPPPRAA
jgi:hypothetical protein